MTQAVKTMPGARGVYYLVDRECGESMAVTLWVNEQAMRASEDQAAQIRQEGAARLGETILSVERFEVALEPSDVLSTV